jgi:flagellar hook protein FlgE
MDVVGNNLANVNTTGFKKNRVNFQDMLSQSMKGAARPNDVVGGVNPQQVGLGMTIASFNHTTFNFHASLASINESDLNMIGERFLFWLDEIPRLTEKNT